MLFLLGAGEAGLTYCTITVSFRTGGKLQVKSSLIKLFDREWIVEISWNMNYINFAIIVVTFIMNLSNGLSTSHTRVFIMFVLLWSTFCQYVELRKTFHSSSLFRYCTFNTDRLRCFFAFFNLDNISPLGFRKKGNVFISWCLRVVFTLFLYVTGESYLAG